MKNELLERQRTIKDKEDKIEKFRKQTSELEKFKFVLDYKIKELKHRVGPRTKQIQDLNEQRTKMDNEMKHFEKKNENLNLISQDMKLKNEGLAHEQRKTIKKIRDQEAFKKQYKDDVYEVLHQHLYDYKKLKKGIVRLHKIYVKGEVNKADSEDVNLHQVHFQTRKHYERTIDQMRGDLQKHKTAHAQDYSRIIKDNVFLTDEINKLIRERHNRTLEIQDIMNKINDMRMRKGSDYNEAQQLVYNIGEIDQETEALQNDQQQLDQRCDFLRRQIQARQQAAQEKMQQEQQPATVEQIPADSTAQPTADRQLDAPQQQHPADNLSQNQPSQGPVSAQPTAPEGAISSTAGG